MKKYRKILEQPMRPYEEGEDMSGISVAECDSPEIGGMIAINPSDDSDRWYVDKDFFNDNYEEVL